MTNEQIENVTRAYLVWLSERGYGEGDLPQAYVSHDVRKALATLNGVLQGAIDFIKVGRREKADRWLGFAQGALWASGVFSIESLRRHSRTGVVD